MNASLTRPAWALFLVLACGQPLAAADAGADETKAVTASPTSLTMTGAANAPLKSLVQIKAAQAVTGLSLTSGLLRGAAGEEPWIEAASVTIAPGSVDLSAGERRDFVVTVAAVPTPGTYSGNVRVAFTDKEDEASSIDVPITVVVSDLDLVTASPRSLTVAGAAGVPLKSLVQIEAVQEVTGLSLTGGLLRGTAGEEPWIEAASVTIAPSSVDLSAGESRHFVVTVAAVPAVGTYSGNLRVAFTAKEAGKASSIDVPITVVVSDLALTVVKPTHKKLRVKGIVGKSTFRTGFELLVSRDITGLEFVTENLSDQRGSSWIAKDSVAVSPAGDFKVGRHRFTVTVSGVDKPGLFKGRIIIRYPGATKDDHLQLRVDADKLTPGPAEIEVRFVSGRGLGGGTAPITKWVSLEQEVERRSSAVLRTLADDLQPRLSPRALPHQTDKSKGLKLQGFAVEKDETGAIGLTFVNPDADPGSYKGNVRLQSRRFGTVATIPVEIKVRGSARLAWLMMIGGLLCSWIITWWQTTGSKRNSLRGDLMKLQRRLEGVITTAAGRENVMGLIAKGQNLIAEDKFTEAETHIGTIATAVTAAAQAKANLIEKASEVARMLKPIQRLRESLEAAEVKPNSAVFGYLGGIQNRVEQLRRRIDDEEFESAADAGLATLVSEFRKATTDLETIVLKITGIEQGIDRVAEIFRRAFPAQNPIAENLKRFHFRDLKEKLENIGREDDVAALTTDIEQAATRLSATDDDIRRLRGFQECIDEGKKAGHTMQESEKRVGELIAQLRLGKPPTMAKVEEVADLIQKDLGQKLDLAPRLESLIRRFDEEAQSFRREDLDGPESSAVVQMEAVVAEEESGTLENWARIWKALRNWFTPDRTERVVKTLLYLVALWILVPIGMNETYWKSDTFGSTRFAIEYLGIFLWGFGIQTSTATAATVMTKLKG